MRGTRACPTCGTDLTPIVRVRELDVRLASEGGTETRRRSLVLVFLAVTVLVALTGFGLGRLWGTSPAPPPAGLAVDSETFDASPVPAAPPAGVPQAAGVSPGASRREALTALRERLDRMTGVALGEEEGALVITFREGLFPTGSHVFGAGGSDRVAAVRDAILDGSEHLSITVEGLTDDQPGPGGLDMAGQLGVGPSPCLTRIPTIL